MKKRGRLRILLAAALIAAFGLDAAIEFPTVEGFALISAAEARVGRPLTPVSVAGVARRTARRCAAGVYRC